jgi:hypothetical protein
VLGQTYKVTITIDSSSGSPDAKFHGSRWDPEWNVSALPPGTYSKVLVAKSVDQFAFANWGGDIVLSQLTFEPLLYPSLITNGTFDADSDWTKVNGFAISGGAASNDGTAASALQQDAGLESNKWYRVLLYCSATDSTVNVRIGSNTITDYNFTTTGWHEFYERADGEFVRFQTSATCTIDNVIIQEVPASISRRYFLRFDGIDDQLTLTDTFGSDMTVVMGMKTSDTQAVLLSGGGPYLRAFQIGSSSTSHHSTVGSPLERLDGAAWSPATWGDAYTDVSDSEWHVYSAVGADLSAWSELILGYHAGGFALAGDVAYAVAFPSDADTLALAEAAAAEKIKIVDPDYALAA